jgi:2'-5' RNA ligase
MVRTFIAVDIDPQVREKISRAITQLRPRFLGVRWVAPANFHLTLKFLGDTEQTRIEAIGAALEERLRPFPRCTINAKGLGVFPDLRRPRIIWVGLAGNELATLAAHVESALLPLDFAPEKRNFSPHLTIGRWRQTDRPSNSLGQELASWKDYEFGATTVDEVILFQSVLKPEGATYYRLKSVTLSNLVKESGDGCEPRKGH